MSTDNSDKVLTRNYNLKAMYQNTFGYSGIDLQKGNEDVSSSSNSSVSASAQGIGEADGVGVSSPNQSVLDGGIYAKSPSNNAPVSRNKYGMPIHSKVIIEEEELPDEPMITVKLSKKITETNVDGVEGSFKEEYSINDYTVTIKGIFISDQEDTYPKDWVSSLHDWARLNKSVSVKNDVLSFFKIDKIAIYSVDFPAVPGEHNAQGWVINAKSDFDFDLKRSGETLNS